LSSPPDQHAARYVLQRWNELCSPRGPWWTRATEVGIRLRLDELGDLSEASHEGATQVVLIVNKLLKEIRELLGPGEDADPYISKRYTEVAEHARELKHVSASSFVRGGLGPSLVKSCLDHLEHPDYIPSFVSHLTEKVASSGHGQDDFRHLDHLISRLDAELVFDGHSQGWRQAVRVEAVARFENGKSLEEAILGSLEAHHCGFGEDRPFAVLVPLTGLPSEMDFNRAGGMKVEPAVTVIKDDGFELDGKLKTAVATADGFSYTSEVLAADAEAAVRIVDKKLRSAIGAWRLMERSIDNPTSAFVLDSATHETLALPLPSEPLEVRPPGIEQWPPEGPSAERLTDALDQLAQARTAPPQTAFVDLWTAADALYGGIARDPSWHAGDVMAGLAQFVYVRDVHHWLAGRAEDAGIGVPPNGGEVEWIVEQITSDASGLDKALAEAGDVIGWSRFKLMSRWDHRWGLGDDLDHLKRRLVSVCDRAYLIRNFAVHRAEVRGPALAVVLPAFAGLVAAAVGHSLAAETDDTLEEALAAGLAARAAAYDFKAERSSAPDGLEPMLNA
jgi:hypothetical protein